MYCFAGAKANIAGIIPIIYVTRDKHVHFQLNSIPEKTHSCC
jgi:hypothetical protein